MDLEQELVRQYGHEIKASELAILFGISLLKIYKTHAQSKGKEFDRNKLEDFAIATEKVAAQITAQEAINMGQTAGNSQSSNVIDNQKLLTV